MTRIQPQSIDLADLLPGDAIVVAYETESREPGINISRKTVLRIAASPEGTVMEAGPLRVCEVVSHGEEAWNGIVWVRLGGGRRVTLEASHGEPVEARVLDLVSSRNVQLRAYR
jgi:hypothetical protein